MEPTAADFATDTLQLKQTTAALRPLFPGVMITNGRWLRQGHKAAASLAGGAADLVSFGVPFLANPDLPARFSKGGRTQSA